MQEHYLNALQAKSRGLECEAVLALAACCHTKDAHDTQLGTAASLFPPAGSELRQLIDGMIQKDVVAIALAVTCYSEEMGLSEAAGAEMRVCVGPTHAAGLDNDLVRYVLPSERYKAAAPCMLVRDNASESGWSIFTRPRVCLANVVVEMIPVLQTMLRQTNVCVPYVLHVEAHTLKRARYSAFMPFNY